MDNYQAIPDTPTHWYSGFTVRDLLNDQKKEDTYVKTVDIYTWVCTKCKDDDNCVHIKCVNKYVTDEMDKYFKDQNASKTT